MGQAAYTHDGGVDGSTWDATKALAGSPPAHPAFPIDDYKLQEPRKPVTRVELFQAMRAPGGGLEEVKCVDGHGSGELSREVLAKTIFELGKAEKVKPDWRKRNKERYFVVAGIKTMD